MNPNNITCSFSMDRDTYNAYKSIVVKNGQNVKGNLVRYMQNVIQYGIHNIDTAAIAEVQEMKRDPNKKTYGSFAELVADLNDEGEGCGGEIV